MKKLMLLFGLVAATVALAADVTGKWTFEMQGRQGGQAQTVTLNLKADGDKLTGTMAGGMGGGEAQISDGKVKGDNVSFKIKRTSQRGEFVMNYKGKVSSDELKLTMSMEGRDFSRDIVAKRAE